MNARPGSAVRALTPPDERVASLVRLRRKTLAVPLALQIVPIAGAFACSYLLYERIAGHVTALNWDLLGGVASFVALFVELRLIDDLDDLDRDHPAAECTAARRSSLLRSRLLAGVAACVILIAVLNFGKWHALTSAAAGTVLAIAAPFGFKRLFPRSFAVGSLLFEGAPLAFFVYCYCFWRDLSGTALGLAAVACVVGLFWTGYEFWKFSRKVHSDAMQPYFLSAQGIRLALNAFLVTALVANLQIARVAALSPAYTIYAAALPLTFLAWLNATWRGAASPRGRQQRPLWAGMTFVAALELVLLAELLPMLGSK
jgi:hypothetical protein